MENYDYVIVGAGSAGCVLANKLGEDKKHKILVLEAGPMDYNLMIHIPAGVYKAYRNPKINWNYSTENEPELFDRNVPMPRGKVIGGSYEEFIERKENGEDPAEVMSDLGIKRYCCRKIFVSHLDLIDELLPYD